MPSMCSSSSTAEVAAAAPSLDLFFFPPAFEEAEDMKAEKKVLRPRAWTKRSHAGEPDSVWRA